VSLGPMIESMRRWALFFSDTDPTSWLSMVSFRTAPDLFGRMRRFTSEVQPSGISP
jgi:hypothetical protein